MLTGTLLIAAVPGVVSGLWGFSLLNQQVIPLARWISSTVGWIPLLGIADSDPDDPLESATIYESSTFVAGIVVSLVIVPTICSVMRESFSQAPVGEREGAYALGATRWGMIRSGSGGGGAGGTDGAGSPGGVGGEPGGGTGPGGGPAAAVDPDTGQVIGGSALAGDSGSSGISAVPVSVDIADNRRQMLLAALTTAVLLGPPLMAYTMRRLIVRRNFRNFRNSGSASSSRPSTPCAVGPDCFVALRDRPAV